MGRKPKWRRKESFIKTTFHWHHLASNCVSLISFLEMSDFEDLQTLSNQRPWFGRRIVCGSIFRVMQGPWPRSEDPETSCHCSSLSGKGPSYIGKGTVA